MRTDFFSRGYRDGGFLIRPHNDCGKWFFHAENRGTDCEKMDFCFLAVRSGGKSHLARGEGIPSAAPLKVSRRRFVGLDGNQELSSRTPRTGTSGGSFEVQ